MAVVVLGMHRSGTSAVTRCINLLGVSLGPAHELLTPNAWNPRGYWENRRLSRLNDQILAAWGGTWYSPPRLAQRWPVDERLVGIRRRARAAIRRVFGTAPWAWKDPRTSLTLPFWRELLKPPICVVLAWRHPVETCLSLSRIHDLPMALCAKLWVHYNRAALQNAFGLPAFIVSYDRLLNDPAGVVDRLAKFLGRHGVDVSEGTPESVAASLAPSLRHYSHAATSPADDPDYPAATWPLLDYLSHTPDAHESLNPETLPTADPEEEAPAIHANGGKFDFRGEWVRLRQQNESLLARQKELERDLCEAIERGRNSRRTLRAEISRLTEGRQRLEGEVHDKAVHIRNLEAMLDEIYGSRAWRVLTKYRKVKYGYVLRAVNGIRGALIGAAGSSSGVGSTGGNGRTHGTDRNVAPVDAYRLWREANESARSAAALRAQVAALPVRPLMSIVMPTRDPDRRHLLSAIRSVQRQVYPNWELCIADDASESPSVRAVLAEAAGGEERIRVRYLDRPLGIAGATNQAFSMAGGEFVGLLDHDDELSADALFEVVSELSRFPETDIFYSDEDKIDETGARCEPFFKPDWAPTTFLSYMYSCHFAVFRRSLMERIGALRTGFDGSQDYDLVLRATEETDLIRHIPKVLYHWRKSSRSTAQSAQNKDYAEAAAIRALNDAARRRGLDVMEIGVGRLPTTYRVRLRVPIEQRVSIIIPTHNNRRLLEPCIDSLFTRTDFPSFSVTVIDNLSDEPDTRAYLREIGRHPRVRVLRYDRPFNFSAINNWAVSQTEGPFLLFLNDDTEVRNSDWLEAMLEHAQRPEVGAVGAKLLYPDGRVQHAGVILGIGGVAGHAHRHFPGDDGGYFSRLQVVQNFSAVTAACILMRRDVFLKVGGFDAHHLPVAFNDVDLCLRIREAGYEIIYTPFAELFHHESASRGLGLDAAEVDYMKKRWHGVLDRDPFYNRNLTIKHEDFSLNF